MDNTVSLISSASDWLLTGLSGHPHVSPPAWAYWHARCMVVGWTILLPVGMLIARFLKVTPRQNWPSSLDNKFWWRCHIRLQAAGLALVLVGLALVYARSTAGSALANAHHVGGWLVIGIGALQLLSGLLRGSKGGPTAVTVRGDHYDMTLRRVIFEYLHKTLGWAAMAVAICVTVAGMVLVDAPRWMAVVIGCWWVAYALIFIWLQAKRRCIDTYQAIWGPDTRHPGNRRPPIGWGINRPSSPEAEGGRKDLPKT